jgi:hypothetical protein
MYKQGRTAIKTARRCKHHFHIADDRNCTQRDISRLHKCAGHYGNTAINQCKTFEKAELQRMSDADYTATSSLENKTSHQWKLTLEAITVRLTNSLTILAFRRHIALMGQSSLS